MQEKNTKISPDRKLFSENLRKLRKDKKLSIRQLSVLLGFSSTTQVWKYEKGISEPSLDVLLRLSEIFSVDLHRLIRNEDSPAIIEIKKQLKALCMHYLHSLSTELLDIANEIGILSEKENLTEEERFKLKLALKRQSDLDDKYKEILDKVAKFL
jgi:transcriptional regulator with XRE-family HTH domain